MLDAANNLLWGKVLIVLLITLGLAFSIASRFIQLRYFGRMFKVFGQAFDHQDGQINGFQAFILSIAGRVGAGNIAGVAIAISVGGPGAIFWMWLVGLLGMATSFLECSLAQLFKTREPDGSYRGGPAHYIMRGLNKKWLAAIFSILLLVSFGLCFSALHSYTVATSLHDAFGIPLLASGIAMAIALGMIIIGGIQRIVKVADVLVPIMAMGYVLVALVVIGMNINEIPSIILLIVKNAFGLEQAFGGGIGIAIMMGVKRGLFSNEAGLGSGPNIAAVAHTQHPAQQGIVQAFSVFIDTLVLCSCTAFIILLSDVYQGGGEYDGVVLTQMALAEHIGEYGRSFVSIALVFFAFSSMMCCYYFGENSLKFFTEENRPLFTAYRIAILALIVWGSMQELSTIFSLADLAMGFLALVNLSALALLFKVGLRLMRDFDQQIRAGIKHPVFDISKFQDLNIDKKSWGQGNTSPSDYERLVEVKNTCKEV